MLPGLNAISEVDLALWDLLGNGAINPYFHLLGGPVRDELIFYATGSRPDSAQKLGFIGGKLLCTMVRRRVMKVSIIIWPC